ncbi:MAG: cytochrome c [Acaryochloridaceae cyanobacterium CSU_3_4]|nr:cytochrome c [Acaryochloridaceae cyanobacterium CSU_3_4]
MDAFKTRVGKIVTTIVLVLVLLVAYIGSIVLREETPYYESPADHFKYGSISTEQKEGVPLLIWEVLPRLFPEYLPRPGGYTALGMTWEEGKETPVGISRRKVLGMERQGITCAICHTATYRKQPQDKPVIVPTGPSSKFDSLGYLRFLEACAKDARFTAGYILPEIEYNHPLSLIDKVIYRVAIPITQKLILQQSQEFEWTKSRPNWGPGRIDPFNPVKFRMLDQPIDDTIGNSDMMPLWNQKLRSGFALHWDGLETSLTETVNTGALGDGATLKTIPIEDLQRVEKYITGAEPPTYPFAIDDTLATQGQTIFEQNCAICHAFGGERTGTVIPQPEVETDRHRLEMWTAEAAEAYNDFAKGYPFKFNNLRKTNGYLSVALDGLWLRAPYLHNGSVPTLQDLLNPPDQRTPIFYRGYDVFDPDRVGFVSQGEEAEYWGFKLDTTETGNSNQGHLYGTDLASQEKIALIEYLKTL